MFISPRVKIDPLLKASFDEQQISNISKAWYRSLFVLEEYVVNTPRLLVPDEYCQIWPVIARSTGQDRLRHLSAITVVSFGIRLITRSAQLVHLYSYALILERRRHTTRWSNIRALQVIIFAIPIAHDSFNYRDGGGDGGIAPPPAVDVVTASLFTSLAGCNLISSGRKGV